MADHPRHALDLGDEPGSGRRPRRWLHAGATWAAAALVVAGTLVGTFTLGSTVRAPTEYTDPSAVMSAEPPTRRPDRHTVRPGLPTDIPTDAASTPSRTPDEGATPTDRPTRATSRPAQASSRPASPSSAPSSAPTSASPTPIPSASPTPSPSPSTEEVPDLGEVIGKRWTKRPVNVRSGPGTNFGVVTTLSEGVEVAVTNVVVDGRWQQVQVDDEVGFISAKYLAERAPSPSESASPTDPESVDEDGISTRPCKAAADVEDGLTPRAVDVLRAVCNEFPNVSDYGGARNDDGYHGSGRAIDVMISGEAGWEIAEWVRDNSDELGAIEVIYAQKIWTRQRSDEGWRSMRDRGDDTANHYDHVHISVR